jgi:hypothetical protein
MPQQFSLLEASVVPTLSKKSAKEWGTLCGGESRVKAFRIPSMRLRINCLNETAL